jgi:hypothetical protein
VAPPIAAPAAMIAGVAVPKVTTASAMATMASAIPLTIFRIASERILSWMIMSWTDPDLMPCCA